MPKTKIVFFDREGVLIPSTSGIHVTTSDIGTAEVLPGVIEGLQNLLLMGYCLVMVTNQEGMGTRSYPTKRFDKIQTDLFAQLRSHGIGFYKVFVCPHFKRDWCQCRKLRLGMVEAFLHEVKMDTETSFVIGNGESDCQFAREIGVSFMRMEMDGHFPIIRLE